MTLIKYEDIFGELVCFHSSEEPLVPLGFLDGIKWLPLNENTLIIGGADIGRTSFLRTIVFHAISQYCPESLLLWLYDAGLCTFKDFSDYQIPHITMNGTEDAVASVTRLIDSLDEEIAFRETLLASKEEYTSFADHFQKTGIALAPKAIVVLNFAETFFRRLRELPADYANRFANAVRVAKTLDICIIMCIQDYAYFIWEHGIQEKHFPHKVTITRANHSDAAKPCAPVALLSTDYSLPWLSPIFLSQSAMQKRLEVLFPCK